MARAETLSTADTENTEMRPHFSGYLRERLTLLTEIYRRDHILHGGIFLSYSAVALFSLYMFNIRGTQPAVILAPQGIALAAALVFGYATIPVTALSSVLISLYAGIPLPLALMGGLANLLQPALTLYILDKFKVNHLLKNTPDFYKYLAVTICTCTIVPTFYVYGREIYNTDAPRFASLIWSNFWLSGLVSMLILTPFLVRLASPVRSFARREWIENIAAIVLLNIPTAILAFTPISVIGGLNLILPFCLILMWIALRGGTFFVTFAMLTVSVSAISGRIVGHPANPDHLDLAGQIVSAQVSLVIFALIFYLIAALEESRRSANQRLTSYARALERAVIEKDAAAEAKNEFIAILGHELRNPLAPIVSAVEILRQPDLPQKEALEMVEVIGHQARQLTALLRDLLDVSRIMRGNIQLSPQSVRMQDIVLHATSAVHPSLSEAKHTISVTIPESDIFVTADPVRIEQILVNLLDNAAKYTDPGGKIAISVAADECSVKISVRDSGIGIPSDMLDKIFDPFVQLKDARSLGKGGLGIGLMLSRNLARLHEGDLSVSSDGSGLGSEFTLSVPRYMRSTSAQ